MNDEKKNMCDEDDSDEILEYTGGSELSDLTFQTGYENYSQWRIKEILKEVGFRLEPLCRIQSSSIPSVSEVLGSKYPHRRKSRQFIQRF